jgi:hypothetical protein
MSAKTLTTISATAIAAVISASLVILLRYVVPFLRSSGLPLVLVAAYAGVLVGWGTKTALARLYDARLYWNWKHASVSLVALVVVVALLFYVWSLGGPSQA